MNRSEGQLLFSSLGKKQGEDGLDMWEEEQWTYC